MHCGWKGRKGGALCGYIRRAMNNRNPMHWCTHACVHACAREFSATNNAHATIKRDCPLDDDISYGQTTGRANISQWRVSPTLDIISRDFRMVLITFCASSMRTWWMAHYGVRPRCDKLKIINCQLTAWIDREWQLATRLYQLLVNLQEIGGNGWLSYIRLEQPAQFFSSENRLRWGRTHVLLGDISRYIPSSYSFHFITDRTSWIGPRS